MTQDHSAQNDAILIESAQWKVALQPHMGLQTLFCKVLVGGRVGGQSKNEWVDIMVDCSQAETDLVASNFHMVPYSNRIRDGKFSFDSKPHTLENAQAHSIHGALRKLPWRVIEQTKSRVTAEYDTAIDGEVNWPWPIKSQVSYAIEANNLVSRISITNNGESTMPAGTGWHPYFCRHVGCESGCESAGASASPTLTIDVAGMYPDTNGDCLPTGKPIPIPSELNFTQAKALDPNQRIDHCFSGFAAPAIIAWPDAGIELKVHASSECAHLVLFNPDKPYFALEPVTNANDGFNLAHQGIDSGMQEIKPGESLDVEMRLELIAS